MTDFLARAVAARPDAVAVDDGRETWTYADLGERAARWARRFREGGAAPGRVVALHAEPGRELVAALHGAFRTGARVAPLHPDLSAPEREAALQALDPVMVVDAGREAANLPDPEAGGDAPTPDEGPVAVLWTSGTSGRPRGVLLTEAGLRASAEGSRLRLGLGPDDVWYASLSPAHVGGLALLVRAAILQCGLAMGGRFSARDLSDLVDRGRVTHASLVPTMLLRLLETRSDAPPPPTLRCLLIGGARAPRDLVDRALAAGFPLALTYGLTEASSQVATAAPPDVRRDPTSVGRPLAGVEVRIDDAGQVHVRGPTVSPGLVDGTRLTDAQGWFATGDLGSLDGDGRLRIVGRRADRIVSGGATVDAHEVEAALRHHPAVMDACVVGLPDATWGELVGAAVVVSPEGPDRDELDRWIRERLSPAKRPRRIVQVDALPRNPNGKVDRAAVRRLLEAG